MQAYAFYHKQLSVSCKNCQIFRNLQGEIVGPARSPDLTSQCVYEFQNKVTRESLKLLMSYE